MAINNEGNFKWKTKKYYLNDYNRIAYIQFKESGDKVLLFKSTKNQGSLQYTLKPSHVANQRGTWVKCKSTIQI